MKVHCNEGVAIRIGPKPCGGTREGAAEASAGVRAGQPLSHDMVFVPGADTLQYVEGNILSRVIASDAGTRRGRRTWHARTLLGPAAKQRFVNALFAIPITPLLRM